MLTAKAGYTFIGCILLITGSQGQERHVCALKGSTVLLRCPDPGPTKTWFTVSRDGSDVMLQDVLKDQNTHIYLGNLTIYSVTMGGSYCCGQNKDKPENCSLSAFHLQVTGPTVTFSPSADVEEGQMVTVNCSTSCSLTNNITYVWMFNSQRQSTPSENPVRHLGPVNGQHTGKYSCSINMRGRHITSPEKTLTVISIKNPQTHAAAVFIILPLVVVLCIRKKTLSQSPQTEASDSVEQVNTGPTYENSSPEPTVQEDHPYTRLIFSEDHTEDVYAMIQPQNLTISHQLQRTDP